MTVIDRFLEYVKFDTTSNPESITCPSTDTQLTFAKFLEKQLIELGLIDVSLDKNGYIMATLPTNTSNNTTIGFIAHMDTAPAFNGKNVNPKIIKNY